MDKEIRRLPDLELEVMLAIWKDEKALHTGEIHQQLGGDKKRPIQAIQTVLSRLGEKGFVRCEKIGRLNYYQSLVAEDAYRAQETATFLERLYGNSPARLVTALVEATDLNENDLAEIRRILDQGGVK